MNQFELRIANFGFLVSTVEFDGESKSLQAGKNKIRNPQSETLTRTAAPSVMLISQ
jgi:hypothetical protein